MIVVHRQPFAVARYHQACAPQTHPDVHGGLVLSVKVRFKTWRPGRATTADVFLDSGADATIFSLRWIAEHSAAGEHPVIDPWHRMVDEGISVEIGGRLLPVPLTVAGPLLRRQGDAPTGWENSVLWQDAMEMPGYEDVLLGRDFFRANGLLLLVDYSERWFSILHPGDAENLQRREHILSAFDPSCPLRQDG